MEHYPTDMRDTRNIAVLRDPLESSLGRPEYVRLPLLDSVAALFPCLFVIFTYFRAPHTLQVWTKVCICGGFLFTLKGMLAAMTTVPDAMGWETCIGDRLKPEGLLWMRGTHSLSEFFFLDFRWLMEYHHPLRYCSDMMYSGHTFCVTLFALGCYESLRILLEGKGVRQRMDKAKNAVEKATYKVSGGRNDIRMYSVVKIASLTLLSVLAIGEQAVEIYFVMLSRFHYSSDILVALVVTFLFYTNSAIAIFAKQWELRGLNVFSMLSGCRIGGPPTSVGKDEWEEKDMWISKGDVYIPWCCIPFCCMSGRGHLYSDDGILEIYCRHCQIDLNNLEGGNEQIRKLTQLINEMNLVEGVTRAELENLMGKSPEDRDRDHGINALKVRLLETCNQV
jgi:hypothetical protein